MIQQIGHHCQQNHANQRKIGLFKLGEQCYNICQTCLTELTKKSNKKGVDIIEKMGEQISKSEKVVSEIKQIYEEIKKKIEEEIQHIETEINKFKEIKEKLIIDGIKAYEQNFILQQHTKNLPRFQEQMRICNDRIKDIREIMKKEPQNLLQQNRISENEIELNSECNGQNEKIEEDVEILIIDNKKLQSTLKDDTLFQMIHNQNNQDIQDAVAFQDEDNQNNILIAFELFSEAQILYSQGQLQEALIQLEQSLQIYGENDEAQFMKGEILFKQQNLNEALEQMNKSLDINPKLGEAQFVKGMILFRLKKFQESLNALKEAEKFPYNYSDQLYVTMSSTLNHLRRHQDSIECSNKAIQFNQNCASAFNNKATSLQELHQYTEALQNFEMAISIEPENSDFTINKAVLLCEMGKFNEAVEMLDQTRNIDPSNMRIYRNKYQALRRLNRNYEALECANQWLEYQPNNYEAKLFKIDALKTLGRYQEAREFQFK